MWLAHLPESARERRVRGHTMCLPHLPQFFTVSATRMSWVLGLLGRTRKARGRVRLSISRVLMGLSTTHAPTPVMRGKTKDAHATSRTSPQFTRKQVGVSTTGRGKTCRQLRYRRQRGTKPIGRRVIGILSILQALTIGENSSLRGRTGFGCLEKNLQPTDAACEQYTHKYSTYRVAQHDHISSREHAWLKSCKAQDCTCLCPKTIVIHVSRLVPCRT